MKHGTRVSLGLALWACMQLAWADPLQGAWRLVDGEYLDEAGKLVRYDEVRMTSIKVVSDGHYSFISHAGERFWGAGAGRYRLDGGHYTEQPMSTSYPLPAGKEYRFIYRFNEDGAWELERWEEGKRVEREVWRRVEGEAQ